MPLIRICTSLLLPDSPIAIRSCSTTFLCIIVLLFQVACSDPDAEMNETLRDEIIHVHDKAMIQTGYLFDLQSRLEELDPPGNDAPQSDSQHHTAQLIVALAEADRAMFRWMNQYQILAVEGDIKADNDYRKKQLEAIRSVSRQTDQAIGDARAFLARSGSAP